MESSSINEKLLKPYDPSTEEATIYQKWEKSGYFHPENMIKDRLIAPDAKPFTIILPPPNVTGVLHMGHAMMLTIQDILIRYKRMQGFRTLWLPGTDHAAIATQSKVEKEIQKKEGKSRYDLGREEMLVRIDAFAQASHDTIVSQMKAMGASLDWSREAFTLDKARTQAVRTVFKKMYDDGLIYRGHRIVNWDPKGQTTISDDEIVHEARKATMYTFKYSRDFPIAISTTRPETKVGDTAVAVHPDDVRYRQYVGQTFEIPDFCGVTLKIKIIADREVDPDFGTGALGVTPAHSMTDWEMAQRHGLPSTQVVNEYAKMTIGDERILGKKTTEAREVIVAWLRENNLLEKEEVIDQNVSTAERTGGIIEPLPKLQWFIDVNKPIKERANKSLKELMREPVASNQINIIPEYFNKTYFHWIDNLRDWCISRQIWYGHRIPVWYKGDEIYVDVEAPVEEGWEQDPDTLDTWFSSAMWTFSTLGWPQEMEDLKIYHPTSVIETGPDILFFWIARMILMTEYVLDTIPFHTVYLHGLVRDAKGQKMSKSLGNALDPLEIATKYGADAARMALLLGTAPGTDSKISEDKIKGQKHFANKIWNVTRYILSNCTPADKNNSYTDSDKLIYQEWQQTLASITFNLDNFKLHLAAEEIYQYFWTTLADKIIEESKPILSGTNQEAIYSRQKLLIYLLLENLQTLHPFMPFVTENLWQIIKQEINWDLSDLLMISPWPTSN